MKHLKYNETRQDIEQLDFEYIKSHALLNL
jgi:hypothetical protein